MRVDARKGGEILTEHSWIEARATITRLFSLVFFGYPRSQVSLHIPHWIRTAYIFGIAFVYMAGLVAVIRGGGRRWADGKSWTE